VRLTRSNDHRRVAGEQFGKSLFAIVLVAVWKQMQVGVVVSNLGLSYGTVFAFVVVEDFVTIPKFQRRGCRVLSTFWSCGIVPFFGGRSCPGCTCINSWDAWQDQSKQCLRMDLSAEIFDVEVLEAYLYSIWSSTSHAGKNELYKWLYLVQESGLHLWIALSSSIILLLWHF